VNASTRSGTIQIRGRLADGESRVHSGFGQITLTLPADSRFRLDARTKFGQVTTGFALQGSAKAGPNHIEGKVGTDPKTVLKVTADSGNIEIRKK
jgi:Putative adhesin